MSDLYLRLAEAKLFQPKWTDEIWAETHRTWIDKFAWDTADADSRRDAAQKAFPEALISGHMALIDKCENDEGDRHVLAAAIYEGIEAIVTFNLKHFKQAHLEPWKKEAICPAKYLCILFDHEQGVVTRVLSQMASKRQITIEELVAKLGRTVPKFASHVSSELNIVLPAI